MSHVIDAPLNLTPRIGSGYPGPFAVICAKREKRALGDAAGLANFGVNHVILPPGAASSQRHWHRLQDEFIWVLEGELTLVTDAGETQLTQGMSAGFPAAVENGHQLVNRSDRPAAYLEIGDRLPGDSGVYPDIDMCFAFDEDGRSHFMHSDGTPW